MKLTVEERGMLLTSMEDRAVAQTLGRSQAWVRAGRAWITEEMVAWRENREPNPAVVDVPDEPAPTPRRGPRLRKPATPPPVAESFDLAPLPTTAVETLQVTEVARKSDYPDVEDQVAKAQPAPVRADGNRVSPGKGSEDAPAPVSVVEHPESPAEDAPPAETTLEPAETAPEDAQAADTTSERSSYAARRFGAPDHLEGSALAAWLYDNTDATFLMIADVSGLTPEEVQRIADGEDIFDPPPPHRDPLKGRYNCAGRYVMPKPPREGVSSPPSTPPALRSEIPPKVLRYARWFVDARWRIATVAKLFDVDPGDLRAALAEQPQRAAA